MNDVRRKNPWNVTQVSVSATSSVDRSGLLQPREPERHATRLHANVHRVGEPVKSLDSSPKTMRGRTRNVALTAGSNISMP